METEGLKSKHWWWLITPRLTKWQLLLIVLGTGRKWISSALLEVAQDNGCCGPQSLEDKAGAEELLIYLRAGEKSSSNGQWKSWGRKGFKTHGKGWCWRVSVMSVGPSRSPERSAVNQSPSSSSPCTRAVRQAEGSHFQGNNGALPPAEVRSWCVGLHEFCSIPWAMGCPRLWPIWIIRKSSQSFLWIVLLEKIKGDNGKIHKF